MRLQQIRYFLSLYETLNFGRAAELCNVSQPSLSRAVSQLEEELGGQIFRRERRHSHVTDLGRALYPHFSRVVAELEAVRQKARSYANTRLGTITLGFAPTICPRSAVSLAAGLERISMDLDLTLFVASEDELLSLLSEGTLDAALIANCGPLPDRFACRTLAREPLVVAFPTGHRFGRHDVLELEDLHGETLLALTGCRLQEELRALADKRRVQIHCQVRSSDTLWLQWLVAHRWGCAVLPEQLVSLPDIETRQLAEPRLVHRIQLVRVRGRRYSPAGRSLLRVIESDRWPLMQR